MESNSRVTRGPWGRPNLRRYTAPERLRLRILGEIAPPRPRTPLLAKLWSAIAPMPSRWGAIGAGFAAGAFAAGVGLDVQLAAGPDPVGREVVSNHVRSLMADHLSDVASPNGEAVRAWFHGKIDYSPPVADMSSIGYSLVGGRLDYVADRPVAALVYSHARHVVNVFACPLQGRGRAASIARQGFNALGWSDSAMQYWVVADLDAGELERFAGALRASKD